MLPFSALSVFMLAAAHLFGGSLKFLNTVPRSIWLSISGGVSIAYVFVHLLPDLADYQQVFSQSERVNFLEHHVYLMAMVGVVVFYGAEQVSRVSKRGRETPSNPAFSLHIASFAFYNALTGYLLVHRYENDVFELLLFTIALGLHFVVNDYGLRQLHQRPYDRVGRWLLAGAVVVGWIVGLVTELPDMLIAAAFSFLAGSTILNVLKEELPEDRESRFWAFAGGAVGYTLLLLII